MDLDNWTPCKEGAKSGEPVDADRWHTHLSSDVSKAILRAVWLVFVLCLSDGTGYIRDTCGEHAAFEC